MDTTSGCPPLTGNSGVHGRFLYHGDQVIEVSDGLRLARPMPGDSLGDCGTCLCGRVFCLPPHFQLWLSKAIAAAASTSIVSLAGPKTAVPGVPGMYHSPPLEFSITCMKCGTGLAVVLQGSYGTAQPVAAVTISVSTRRKMIVSSS